MSLDKVKELRWKKEWSKFFYGVALGTILGVMGNLWASFFMKVLEVYHVEFEPKEWLMCFLLLSIIVFVYGVGLVVAFGKGYWFRIKEGVSELTAEEEHKKEG